LEQGFASFYHAWQDAEWRDILNAAIYWYLLGNSPGHIDRGVVSACSALEAIGFSVDSYEGKPRTQQFTSSLKYTTHLEALQQKIKVDITIPEHMSDLREFGKVVNARTGPSVIRAVRNVIVHPTAE